MITPTVLLLVLVYNKGVILSRTRLMQGIWDITGEFVNDNTLTVYMKCLRDKLEEDPQEPKLIKTIRRPDPSPFQGFRRRAYVLCPL